MFILTSATTEKALLQVDCFYLQSIAKEYGNAPRYLVLTGALLVTFCACFNCMVGASRVVDTLVKDTMFGSLADNIFGRTRIGGNPILAIIVSDVLKNSRIHKMFIQFAFQITFLLMAGCLFVGGLNQIAQLASVLYLLSYSTVNIACLFLEWASVWLFCPLIQRTS